MWICRLCGEREGKKPEYPPTWHYGVCDWCKQRAIVTEPRDFLIFPKDNNNDNRND